MKQSKFTAILRSLTIAIVAMTSVGALSRLEVFAQDNADLRIMSYNVRNAKGLDDKTDYARVADVIKRENPDVVAIQELDKETKRSKGVDVLGELAKLTDMTPSFGPAIDYQGGKYGIGVLSKEKPVKTEYIPLPGTEEERCLLVVEFEEFVFCCSHWSLTRKDRDLTVALVTNKMKEQHKPTFVCGDFNAQPNDEAIRNLQKDWTILSADKFTFPANEPTIRIDYICAADPQNKISSEEWLKAVKNARVVDEPVASDHRPIALEIDKSVFKK